MSFPFDALRRAPDVEGTGLVAADAADRLILDESHGARAAVPADGIVAIGDSYGALALASAAEAGAERGRVRVHQDALPGEQAIAANAVALGLTEQIDIRAELDRTTVAGARIVLLRLPRALDSLRDVAGLIAAQADPRVVVFGGGRVKHMTTAMNDVLGEFFARVDVTHARQKSRVLIAREPRHGRDPQATAARVDGLELRAFGGTFGGARVDGGTRLLLDRLDAALDADLAARSPERGGTPDDPWLDLACGNGIIAAHLARRHPSAHLVASDSSAVAVASARETVAANGVSDRVEVVRADGLGHRPDARASLVTLNPPFHSGAAVTDQIAPRLFSEAARALRPGGELWCVWNSPLHYRPALERIVGPTRQVARDRRFTVTVSTRR